MLDVFQTITGGFFDSINQDRLYSADQMNMPYKKLITDGIILNENSADSPFEVAASGGMTVNVGPGNALIGGKWAENEETIMVEISGNTSVAARIDSIILRIDKSLDVRAVGIVYRQGAATAPDLEASADVKEFRLANIAVANNATSITAANITDTRGGSECPYVTSIFDPPEARYIIEEYNGSELAGAHQTVKSAFDTIRYAAQSGQPTIALQAADMTEYGKVYLYEGSEDGYDAGYLYYYSATDSAWIRGAQYGASVVDTSLDANSENPVQNKAVAAAFSEVNGRLQQQTTNIGDLSELETEEKSDLVSALNEVRQSGGAAKVNLLDSTELTTGSVVDVTGQVVSTSYITQYAVTDFIPVSSGSIIELAYVEGKNIPGGALYDSEKNFICPVYGTADFTHPAVSVNAPFSWFNDNSDVAFIRYNLVPNGTFARDNQYVYAVTSALNGIVADYIEKHPGRRNLLSGTNVTENKVIGENGELVSASGYAATDFIPVNYGEFIELAYLRGARLPGGGMYDAEKNFIRSIWGTEGFEKPLQMDSPGPFSWVNTDEAVSYIRYNIVINLWYPRTDQYAYGYYSEGTKALANILKNKAIYVGPAGTTGVNFNKIKDVCEYIYDNRVNGATVYVLPGTYNLVDEYGSEYLESVTGSASLGPNIGNNTKFVFSEGAYIKFNYSGANAVVSEHFSAFNVYGSFALENADIEVTNARYCIHEDVPTSAVGTIPARYTAEYKNCRMKHNGNTVGTYRDTACIGAGTNKNSLSIVDGGVYDCGESYPAAVSYHNFSTSAAEKSRVIIKDAWINNSLRLYPFRNSLIDAEISGCYIPNGIIGGGQYFNITQWNNAGID